MNIVGGSMLKLPTEIIYDILLRVPIRTLSVCRWVCKAWYNTIKHPRFIKAYNTTVLNNSPCLIFQTGTEPGDAAHLVDHQSLDTSETSLIFYTPKLPPQHERHRIYSCNGLLLLVSGWKETCCFICNPITGEHIVVPNSPLDTKFATRRVFKTIIGFGCDPASSMSKMIKIRHTGSGTHVEAYNFGTHMWTARERVAFFMGVRLHGNTIMQNTFLNGALHWIAAHHREFTIVSLQLDTEEFKQVPVPPGLNALSRTRAEFRSHGCPRYISHYLLLLEECLSLVHYGEYYDHVEIWMMTEYGLESSWEKKYIIRNISVMDTADPISGPYKPIKVMPNGEILLLCCQRNLGYYHPDSKRFRPIDCGDVLRVPQPLVLKLSLHVGSLLSPGDITS